MNAFTNPPPTPRGQAETPLTGLTLADARHQLAGWADLPQQRRDNLASAISGIARICGLPEAAVELNCRFLNERLFSRPPVAYGFGAQRFGSICSSMRTIMRRMDVHAPPLPGPGELAPAWRDLYEKIPNLRPQDKTNHRQTALIGFMGFCCASGTAPEKVSPDTLDRYDTWLHTMVLADDPGPKVRQTASNWNWACKAVESWPQIALSRPGMRREYTFPLEQYPPSFQADAQRFLDRLAGDDEDEVYDDDVIEEDAPRRLRGALRPRTIEGRRNHLRHAAAALVLQGIPITELRSLRDLVQPLERPRLIRKFYRDRHGKEPNAQVSSILEALRQVARFHCWMREDQRLPPAHLAKISKWARDARPPFALGMTEKNKVRLMAITREEPRALLQHLPSELLKQSRANTLTPLAAARLVAYGVALEILLTFPMRRHNLASLRLDQHLQWLDGRHRPVSHIFLSPAEMKNKNGMKWPLAAPTADLIEVYLKHYRPILAAAGNPYLFAGPGLNGRSAHELAIGLCELIEREIGLKLNLHLLRHFAAWTYLNRNPGAYEVVRQVLGHKNIRVTIACYTGLEVDGNARHFDAEVLQDREANRLVAQAAFRTLNKRNGRTS